MNVWLICLEPVRDVTAAAARQAGFVWTEPQQGPMLVLALHLALHLYLMFNKAWSVQAVCGTHRESAYPSGRWQQYSV